MATMPTSFRVTYFQGRGRGEVMRLMLELAGRIYEDRRLDVERWEKMKPSKHHYYYDYYYYNNYYLCYYPQYNVLICIIGLSFICLFVNWLYVNNWNVDRKV